MRTLTSDDMESWSNPGAHNVAPGVFRLPLPLPMDGLRAVNVYAIHTDAGLVLVDGGWAVAEARKSLETALDSVGYGLADIQRFVVTHMHRDHYTQAVAIRREFGAKVSIGIGEQDSLRVAVTDRGPAGQAQLDQLVKAGAGSLIMRLRESGFGSSDQDLSNLEAPDDWLLSGQSIQVNDGRDIVALHTPGHTQGHLVFVDKTAGVMFAGDHVLPHITPSIGFEPAPGHLPLRDYMDSLRRVRALPDLMLLPAHGWPSASVHARVDELLTHHEQRLAACKEEVRPRGSTPYQVARRLPWTSRGRGFNELDPFNQMLAICETMAHLDLLVERLQLRRQTNHSEQSYFRR